MSLISKLTTLGAAGAASGGTDVDQVFSTHVYDGTGSAQTIANGVDFSNGGAIWTKRRDSSSGSGPWFNDTARGINRYMSTSSASQSEGNSSSSISATSATGYTLGGSFSGWNNSSGRYVSWSFAKHEKFFDLASWNGNEVSGRTISHNLGSTPGMVIIKKRDTDTNYVRWFVWHRSLASGKFLTLNTTNGETNNDNDLIYDGVFDSAPDSSGIYLQNQVNQNQYSYFAYFFAHNNNDGGFGPDSDKDIIKCGTFNRSTSGTTTVNLGFEPQWLLLKRKSGSGNWFILDDMRGIPFGDDNSESMATWLHSDSSNSETVGDICELTSTGFQSRSTHQYLDGGEDYIYVAIRRGPLASPSSASDVFNIDTRGSTGDGNEPAYRSTFPVDFALNKTINSATNWTVKARVLGKADLNTNTTSATQTANYNEFDYMNGHFSRTDTDANQYSWMWRRGVGYFDVCSWTGNDSAGRAIPHNLGVVPEMIWVKNRDAMVEWMVYHKDVSNAFLKLNTTATATGGYAFGQSSSDDSQTATNFYVSSGNGVNELNKSYIGALFATLPGISKVGSVNINSTSNFNVDCGFSNGARMVIVKSTNSAAPWYMSDTTRGINSGLDDPLLFFDSTSVENTASNWIEPYSAGFTIRGQFWNGYNLIFYAVA